MAWLTGWSRRKEITIPAAQVPATWSAGTDYDFPMPVVLSGETWLGAVAKADGGDIRFTLADGTTILSWERVSWSLAGGTITATYWVKIPSLSAVADTKVYCYAGKADATGVDNNPTGVWSNGYRGVWHFHGDMADATGLNAAGNVTGAFYNAAGIDGGQDLVFDGVDDYAAVPDGNSLDLTTSLTLEIWAKQNTVKSNNYMMVKHGVYADDTIASYGFKLDSDIDQVMFWIVKNNVLNFAGGGNLNGWSGAAVSPYVRSTTWHHYAVTWNNSIAKLYIDGTYIGDKSLVGPADADVGALLFGYLGRAATFFSGALDEPRIAAAVRSPAWITLSSNALTSQSSVVTWTANEAAPVAGKPFLSAAAGCIIGV